MNSYSSKSAFYLGVFSIGLGLIANKWILEVLFSSDGFIESSRTIFLIAIVQVILIGIGIYLVIQKPRIDLPSRKNFALLAVTTFISIMLVEITLRIWINHFSTDEQYCRYSLYSDIPSENYQWSSHHYLNYYPTPNYKTRPHVSQLF